MNICLTSLFIKETEIKITTSHHYTPIIMAPKQNETKQTNLTIARAGEHAEHLELPCTDDWNEILCSHFGKEFVLSKIYTCPMT